MEPSIDDGFKWFGEGFDGFPKRLPDDTVEYCINIIDSKLAQAKVVTRLKEVLKDANTFLKELLSDYIWQREEFKLDLELNACKLFRSLENRCLTCLSYLVAKGKYKLWGLDRR